MVGELEVGTDRRGARELKTQLSDQAQVEHESRTGVDDQTEVGDGDLHLPRLLNLQTNLRVSGEREIRVLDERKDPHPRVKLDEFDVEISMKLRIREVDGERRRIAGVVVVRGV
ncbi:MAG: hypothetical protein ACHREM_07065 [Polyangiales bacterium]